MAIDWNKEVSFSGLMKSGSSTRRDGYPTKTHMNFAGAEKKQVDKRRVVIVAIVGIIVLGVVLKFGVFDFVGQVAMKNMELDHQRQELAEVEQNLVGYDEVLAEYQSYVSNQLASDSEAIDAMEALRIVEDVVMPAASVTSLDYKDNQITLNLANTTLARVGDVANVLDEDPMVASVNVSTAAAGQTQGNDVTVTMTITLQKEAMR